MAISTRERNLLIVLGGVAVVALLVFLLVGREGPPEEAAPTPAPSPPTLQPSPPADEPTRRRPPRTFAFFGGRDPFVPLVVEVAEDVPVTDDDDAPMVDEPPPDAERDEAPGAVVGGRRVVLLDVFTEGGRTVAQVQVDGETFVVGEGDRFARNFRVLSISAECITLLFGDERLTVCEGERPK